jgi:7-keto-8-aminopelargonate synthetase-like enzyme
MEVSEYLVSVERMHQEARTRGLFFQIAEDGAFDGIKVTLKGKTYRAFTSCSYLGLERHPAIVAGVHDAVERYGAQFASSRGYISCPLYEEFEANLCAVFDAWALPVPTTTLGHQIALGVLATEKDAIVLDHQAHHSVQMAATLSRANGAHVELVRHSELDQADDLVARLARKHRTVWIACDGVFSMYGDLAPVGILSRLLSLAPNIRLYIDDAHGMSWAGKHGRGSFLSRMPMSERVVVCTSLCKGFGAGGATLVFANRAERELVRMCGGPMVFSGPMQPPMIGAANASAKIHLSDEIVGLQAQLATRTQRCNQRMRALGMPLLVENEAPIFFVRLGLPRAAFDVSERLMQEGMYVNVSMYPTVPMKRAGIRLALTTAHSLEEIDHVVDALAEAVEVTLAQDNVSHAQLDAIFERALPQDAPQTKTSWGAAMHSSPARESMVTPRVHDVGLTIERYHSIHEVDHTVWNGLMGQAGMSSWEALEVAEKVFRDDTHPEHHWDFDYVLVRDQENNICAATYFTTTLLKDDMLARDAVSKAVEERRRDDRYFLTSRVTMMGSLISEGDHFWIDRAGPWSASVVKMIETAEKIHDERGAAALLLRDLPGNDEAMDTLMQVEGLVKVPMLDRHLVSLTWKDGEELIASAKRRARPELRRVVDTAHESHVVPQCGDATYGVEHLSVSRTTHWRPCCLTFVGCCDPASSRRWPRRWSSCCMVRCVHTRHFVFAVFLRSRLRLCTLTWFVQTDHLSESDACSFARCQGS